MVMLLLLLAVLFNGDRGLPTRDEAHTVPVGPCSTHHAAHIMQHTTAWRTHHAAHNSMAQTLQQAPCRRLLAFGCMLRVACRPLLVFGCMLRHCMLNVVCCVPRLVAPWAAPMRCTTIAGRDRGCAHHLSTPGCVQQSSSRAQAAPPRVKGHAADLRRTLVAAQRACVAAARAVSAAPPSRAAAGAHRLHRRISGGGVRFGGRPSGGTVEACSLHLPRAYDSRC